MAKGNHEQSLEAFEKAKQLFRLSPYYALLFALANHNVGNHVSCLSIIEDACKDISKRKSLTDAEKKYLTAYANYLGHFAELEMDISDHQYFLEKVSDVDLEEVPKRLKDALKLTAHKDWKLDPTS